MSKVPNGGGGVGQPVSQSRRPGQHPVSSIPSTRAFPTSSASPCAPYLFHYSFQESAGVSIAAARPASSIQYPVSSIPSTRAFPTSSALTLRTLPITHYSFQESAGVSIAAARPASSIQYPVSSIPSTRAIPTSPAFTFGTLLITHYPLAKTRPSAIIPRLSGKAAKNDGKHVFRA